MQDFIGVEVISYSECRVLVGPFPSMKEHSEAIGKITRLETFSAGHADRRISCAQENFDSDLAFCSSP